LGISALLAVFFIGCSQIQVVEDKATLPDEPANEVSRQEEIREFLNCQVMPRLVLDSELGIAAGSEKAYNVGCSVQFREKCKMKILSLST
jgi:hypothetical protein